jgi:hypothetical protein
MQGQRLADEGDRAGGLDLQPRQLLRGAQRGQLRLQPFLADLAAGGVENADLVVDDERAERRRTAPTPRASRCRRSR